MNKYRIDFLALFVAVIALGFSIWQGREQVQHNHISVEPRINSYFSNDGKRDLWGIYLTNNGMGTGFVKELNVFVDGMMVRNHENGKFYSALVALKLNPLCFIVGNPRKNDSFKVGYEQFLIEASEDSNVTPKSCPVDRLLLIKHQKERLDYKLIIESIYGDEFEYQYSKNKQVRINKEF